MATKKKSWTEKLHTPNGLPKIEELKEKGATHWGGKTMFIPSPEMVNDVMKSVPKGKIITVAHIRDFFAKKFATDIACPLTTGIFTWIAANAAEEQKQMKAKNTTPYWRTLKTGGILNEKYPGGIESQKKHLEDEGFKVIKKGKNFIVANLDRYVFDPFLAVD